MNVLYVAPALPFPPDRGDRIRAFHHIRELAKEHRIHLVCGVYPGDDIEGAGALRRCCASLEIVPLTLAAIRARAAWAFVRGEAQARFSHVSPEFMAAVDAKLAAERYDVVLGYSLLTGELVRRADGIPKVIDFVDAASELRRERARHARFPWSWLSRLEARRLARYESALGAGVDATIASSEIEAAACRHERAAPVSVVGNGVDLDYFRPDAEPATPAAAPPCVLFMGTMDYAPNVDAVGYFCGAILGRIRAHVADVQFEIVGRNPAPAVRALARDAHVTVTGTVPDVRPHLAKALVAVAPFRFARGVQNKVLEAMAMGVPVVGTSLAFQGLAITEDDGVRRADDPETFARGVSTLLRDANQRRKCALRARRYVERSHRWEDEGARLRRVLLTVAKSR